MPRCQILCSVDRASLYVIVNTANLVHSSFHPAYQTVIHTE